MWRQRSPEVGSAQMGSPDEGCIYEDIDEYQSSKKLSPVRPFKRAYPPPGKSLSDSPEVPSHRNSVFTYSPASPSQAVWEQYYYYPRQDQPVTPGHAMGESYLESGESPALGMRRRRDPIKLDELATPDEPAPGIPTNFNIPTAVPRKQRTPERLISRPPRAAPPSGGGLSDFPQVPSPRRSVSSQSTPSPSQPVWDQYYNKDDYPVELTTPDEQAPGIPTNFNIPTAVPRKQRTPERPISKPTRAAPPSRGGRSDSPQAPSPRRSMSSQSAPSPSQPVWDQYYKPDDYIVGLAELTTPDERAPDIPTTFNIATAVPRKQRTPERPISRPPRAAPPSGEGRSDSPQAVSPRRSVSPQSAPTSSDSAWERKFFFRDIPQPEEPPPELHKSVNFPKPAPRQPKPPEKPATGTPKAASPNRSGRSDSYHVPPHRGSVFTYSAPSSTQGEWEPYYYYPLEDRPVTPGHPFTESFLNSEKSRQRDTVEGDTQQVPQSARKSPQPKKAAIYSSGDVSPYDPNQTQSSIIRRLSFSSPATAKPTAKPRSSETKKKKLSTSYTPGQKITQQKPQTFLRYPYEEMAALDSTMTPSPTTIRRQSFSRSTAPQPGSSRAENTGLYMRSPSSFPVETSGRRRLSYHDPSPEANEPRPPSPSPLFLPPSTTLTPPPPSPPSPPLPPPPPPQIEIKSRRRPEPKPRARKRLSSVLEEKAGDEVRKPWISCCSVKAEFARRKQLFVPTSTPVESHVRFGVKSLSPIPNSDTSGYFYDGESTPSIYSDQRSRTDLEDSSHFKHNRSFAQSSSRSPTSFSSPLTPRGRSRSMDLDESKLPTPPTSKQLYAIDSSIQHREFLPSKRAPRRAVGPVERLSQHNFNRFVNDQQMAVVMFYNSKIDPPGTEKNWGEHSLKGPLGVDPAFGTVDCAREQELCTREKILSHPFFKLYVKGSLVNAVKDFGLMSYP